MKIKKKQTKKTRSAKKDLESPKNTKNNKFQIRIERPLGITLLIKEYQNTKDQNLLSTIYNKYITNYVQSGFRIQGKQMNLPDFASYLGLGLGDVIKKVHQQIRVISGITDNKGLEELSRAMVSMCFFGALEARYTAKDQAQRMLQAQGGSYAPFISQTANSAIKNWLDAEKGMVGLLGTLLPKSGTNINIQNNNQGLVQNNEYLTTHQAIKILTERGTGGLLRKPDLKNQLHLNIANQNPDLPEVIATKQQGFQNERVPILGHTTPQVVSHEDRNELDGDILDGVDL